MTACYKNHADKADKYIRVVIPEILSFAYSPDPQSSKAFAAWLFEHDRGRELIDRVKSVHEGARRGRYVEEVDANGRPLPCDEVRPMHRTLAEGGDCEDWAAVQLAACYAIGVPAYLQTWGEPHDHFLHVDVSLVVGDRVYTSNPKGSQRGMNFGLTTAYSIRRHWMQGFGGEAHEVYIAPGVLA